MTSKVAEAHWFFIEPVPASRPRVPRFGKPFYTGRYAEYRELMAAYMASHELPEPRSCSLSVEVTFICTRPKKPANDYPKGDIDNYVKAILDSINGKAFMTDDRVITHLCATKRYAIPGELAHTYITFTEGS